MEYEQINEDVQQEIKLEEFVVNRILTLCDERNMSKYRLCQITGIAQSSLSTMIHGKTLPSVATLAKICEGLGISVFDFFNRTEASNVITNQERVILRYWNQLNERQKEVLLAFAKGLIAQTELKV